MKQKLVKNSEGSPLESNTKYNSKLRKYQTLHEYNRNLRSITRCDKRIARILDNPKISTIMLPAQLQDVIITTCEMKFGQNTAGATLEPNTNKMKLRRMKSKLMVPAHIDDVKDDTIWWKKAHLDHFFYGFSTGKLLRNSSNIP